MSILKTQKSWQPKELAIVYHLLIWGKTTKEVMEIVEEGLAPGRTRDAITGITGEMRRWISGIMGYPVGDPVSKSQADKFNRASRIRPVDGILRFKPLEPSKSDFIPSRSSLSKKSVGFEAGITIPEVNHKELASQSFNQPGISETDKTLEFMTNHPNLVRPEPTLIEIIEAARALGVKEIEYKGLILKF